MNYFINPHGAQQQKPEVRTTRRIVVKDINQEQGLFGDNEATTFDLVEGAHTGIQKVVHKANCGHLVGLKDEAELHATCGICDGWLCDKCSQFRCYRCNRITCPTCVKIIPDVGGYCPRCWLIVLFKRLSLGFLTAFHKGMSRKIE